MNLHLFLSTACRAGVCLAFLFLAVAPAWPQDLDVTVRKGQVNEHETRLNALKVERVLEKPALDEALAALRKDLSAVSADPFNGGVAGVVGGGLKPASSLVGRLTAK